MNVADYLAQMSGGFWEAADGSGSGTGDGSEPTEPTLAVSNDGDGDAVTATVAGDDTATHTLYYRKAGDATWNEGSGRTGDGTIAQSGLDDHTVYWFICIPENGTVKGVPSQAVAVHVTSGSTRTLEILHVANVDERGVWVELLCKEVAT